MVSARETDLNLLFMLKFTHQRRACLLVSPGKPLLSNQTLAPWSGSAQGKHGKSRWSPAQHCSLPGSLGALMARAHWASPRSRCCLRPLCSSLRNSFPLLVQAHIILICVWTFFFPTEGLIFFFFASGAASLFYIFTSILYFYIFKLAASGAASLFYIFTSLLEYNCFTMLYQSVL